MTTGEKSTKTLQPHNKVVKSLLNLRDELYLRSNDASSDEIFFKINSCLYKEYPHIGDTDVAQEE
jgi:hypothetical protein